MNSIIIAIFISIELPDIDLSVDDTEKNKYEIVTDSLTNEKIINASFSWRFRDNNLRRKKYDLSFRLLEKDVKKAAQGSDDLLSHPWRLRDPLFIKPVNHVKTEGCDVKQH